MRLTVVVPATEHEPELTRRCCALAVQNAAASTAVIVFDNGIGPATWAPRVGPGYNIGSYPAFHAAAALVEADVLLFAHNDLLIYEEGYDRRVLDAFEQDPKLGLLGFIGSNEIDFAGGRGRGTRSNFQGREPGCSPAEAHGVRDPGLSAAAVVDGCAMAFRREVLLGIPFREELPPHHWYDRVLSCDVLTRGFHVAVLGIACDHLNGRTANSFEGYHDLARRWCEEHNCSGVGHGPDHDCYLEGQRIFWRDWQDTRFIPLTVGARHAHFHTHPGVFEGECACRARPITDAVVEKLIGPKTAESLRGQLWSLQNEA